MSSIADGRKKVLSRLQGMSLVSAPFFPIFDSRPFVAESHVVRDLLIQRGLEFRNPDKLCEAVSVTIIRACFIGKIMSFRFLRYASFQRTFYHVATKIIRAVVIPAIK